MVARMKMKNLFERLELLGQLTSALSAVSRRIGGLTRNGWLYTAIIYSLQRVQS